jgi:hypothetical protein
MGYHLEWYLYQELKNRRKTDEPKKIKKIKKKHLIFMGIFMVIFIGTGILFRKSYWLFYFI